MVLFNLRRRRWWRARELFTYVKFINLISFHVYAIIRYGFLVIHVRYDSTNVIFVGKLLFHPIYFSPSMTSHHATLTSSLPRRLTLLVDKYFVQPFFYAYADEQEANILIRRGWARHTHEWERGKFPLIAINFLIWGGNFLCKYFVERERERTCVCLDANNIEFISEKFKRKVHVHFFSCIIKMLPALAKFNANKFLDN